MRLSPVLAGLRTYPFVRLNEAKRELTAARRRRSSTSGSASRARRRRSSSARRWPRRSSRCPAYPSAEGLPELRAAIAAWARAPLRRRAGPGHRGRADARLQGGDLPPRAGRRRRPRRRSRRRLPGVRARRGVRRQASCSSCRCWPRTASCPTSTRSRRRRGRASAVLWLNYPNNPTGRHRPARVLRARRRAGPRARLRAGLRRGLLRALLRRRRRRRRRCRSPTARTCSSSTRSPSARRCRATAPASPPATRS